MSVPLEPAACWSVARRALARLGPWDPASPTLLACSGGADSTFLARVWLLHAAGRGLVGRAVVVDHGHRPGTALAAERARARLEELGLPAEIRVVEVAGSAENLLREARYQALRAAAREHGARVVLTAHHADDQAETLLLRILRTTGMRGLAGIPRRRPLAPGVELRRPLLDLRRASLRAALRAEGIPWEEDPSNGDPGVAARNLLRAEILPRLGPLAAGDPVRSLVRLAAEAAEARAATEELLASGFPWEELPSWFRRQALAAVLRDLGETVSPRRLMDLEGALLARGRAGIDAARSLQNRGGRLVLRRRGSDGAEGTARS